MVFASEFIFELIYFGDTFAVFWNDIFFQLTLKNVV